MARISQWPVVAEYGLTAEAAAMVLVKYTADWDGTDADAAGMFAEIAESEYPILRLTALRAIMAWVDEWLEAKIDAEGMEHDDTDGPE